MRKVLKLTLAYGIYFAVIVLLLFMAISSKNNITTNNILGSKKINTITINQKNAYEAGLKFGINFNPVSKEKVNHSLINDANKYIILTFDDGWLSQYAAFKALQSLKGTLYICPSLIGKKDRLSLEHLKEMYKAGWDICNHTDNHTNLTRVSLEKASKEVYNCSLWIKNNGFTRNSTYLHFAYPEGAYNENILQILKQQNILTARTTNPGDATTDFLQLGRTSLYGMTRKNIRDVILSDKKLLILSFHRVVPDNSTEIKEIDLKESYFKEVIDSIHDSKRKVITITEWYKLNHE